MPKKMVLRAFSTKEFTTTRYILPSELLWKLATIALICILSACQSVSNNNLTSTKNTTDTKEFIHQDSTQYFANRTASISMRATLENNITSSNNQSKPLIIQPLHRGYQLQFRSIQKDHLIIEDLFIVSGGKRILIAQKPFLLTRKKAITLYVSLKDTKFINQQEKATLQFKYNKKSFVYNISNHQLIKFIPDTQ